jgi:hypothetical protein
LCATVISRCINASGAVGSDLDARDASCLVCHRRFGGEDNSWDMVVWPRLSECALQDSLSNRKRNVRLCCLVPCSAVLAYAVVWKRGTSLTCLMVTKWFYSTRLETRTKESNICASSWVVKLACEMKVITEMLASVADRSTGRGLSMSISVRTRKMVNYACEG